MLLVQVRSVFVASEAARGTFGGGRCNISAAEVG